MSVVECSSCGRYRDPKNAEGRWDVPQVNSTERHDFICGVCEEQYITEDGLFDPDLPEKECV